MREASGFQNFKMYVISQNQHMKTNFPVKALVTLVTSRLQTTGRRLQRRCFWLLYWLYKILKRSDRRISVQLQDQMSLHVRSYQPGTGQYFRMKCFSWPFRTVYSRSVNTFYSTTNTVDNVLSRFFRSLQYFSCGDKRPLQDSRLPSVLSYHSE